MIRLYVKVKNWSRVIAKVLHKEMFIHPKYSNRRAPYGLKVRYVYQYNFQDFEGRTIYLAELAGGQVDHMKKTAEEKLNKIEDTMYVYVNQADPTQSVMYCSGIGLYVFILIMGIFSLLVGLTYALV